MDAIGSAGIDEGQRIVDQFGHSVVAAARRAYTVPDVPACLERLGGDARVPGPSTYWIDALVQLQPEDAARLRRLHEPQAAAGAPEVVEGLRPLLPAGPWSRSAALDAALSQQGFVVRAFMSGDHLVLTALGQ